MVEMMLKMITIGGHVDEKFDADDGEEDYNV